MPISEAYDYCDVSHVNDNTEQAPPPLPPRSTISYHEITVNDECYLRHHNSPSLVPREIVKFIQFFCEVLLTHLPEHPYTKKVLRYDVQKLYHATNAQRLTLLWALYMEFESRLFRCLMRCYPEGRHFFSHSITSEFAHHELSIALTIYEKIQQFFMQHSLFLALLHK